MVEDMAVEVTVVEAMEVEAQLRFITITDGLEEMSKQSLLKVSFFQKQYMLALKFKFDPVLLDPDGSSEVVERKDGWFHDTTTGTERIKNIPKYGINNSLFTLLCTFSY